MAKDEQATNEIISIARNRRARHDYHIMETWEAGLVLTGTEVKALREGKANIGDAYGIVKNGEVWLLNLHISPYERGGYANHEPDRKHTLSHGLMYYGGSVAAPGASRLIERSLAYLQVPASPPLPVPPPQIATVLYAFDGRVYDPPKNSAKATR